MELENCKRLVIVGNGGSSLNNKNGSFIDNSEIVIRIKGFVTEGFEDFVGTKTNIWCTKWFNYKKTFVDKIWLPFINPYSLIINKNIKKLNEFILINQFEDRILDLEKHNNLIESIGIKNIVFVTESELLKCLSNLKMEFEQVYTKSGINMYHPTTYLLSIFLAIERFPEYKIYITGFDNFKKGYYWNLNENKRINKTWPHQYEKEDLFLKKLTFNNKINLI